MNIPPIPEDAPKGPDLVEVFTYDMSEMCLSPVPIPIEATILQDDKNYYINFERNGVVFFKSQYDENILDTPEVLIKDALSLF